MLNSNVSINKYSYCRYEAALEEARTVDRIVACLGEKALDALATDSPFLGEYTSEDFPITTCCQQFFDYQHIID